MINEFKPKPGELIRYDRSTMCVAIHQGCDERSMYGEGCTGLTVSYDVCLPATLEDRLNWPSWAIQYRDKDLNEGCAEAGYGLSAPLEGFWHIRGDVLVCNGEPVARFNFDNFKSSPKYEEVLLWLCATLNASNAAVSVKPFEAKIAELTEALKQTYEVWQVRTISSNCPGHPHTQTLRVWYGQDAEKVADDWAAGQGARVVSMQQL